MVKCICCISFQVVKITFHAFLSPNVILDLEKDSIVVVFSGPLDNWTKKHILTPCDAKSYVYPFLILNSSILHN